MRIVDEVYKGKEDLQAKLQAYAKEYAPKSIHRVILHDLKKHLHHDTHTALINTSITYD